MKVYAWQLLISHVLVGLLAMLSTMMTQDIWSAHSSWWALTAFERYNGSVEESCGQAHQSFLEMHDICQGLKDALLAGPPRKGKDVPTERSVRAVWPAD